MRWGWAAGSNKKKQPDELVKEGMNEYLAAFKKVKAQQGMYARDQRFDMCQEYSFAIPNDEALDALGALGPLVEMGAGTGYWAHLLQQRGVDILAFDEYPVPGGMNPYSFTRSWTEVTKGTTNHLSLYGGRALFLCWPCYALPFAMECLRAFKGNTLAYVGEWNGCTADGEFHTTLWDEWEEVRVVDIPRWPGMHDRLYIFNRKEG